MGPRLAIVAIGRNEGERLGRCLDSVLGRGVPVVYVDSGSSDGSAALARRRGVSTVELDAATPFTAGRARNAGMAEALALHPELELIQFVDGDCQLVSGWIERGRREFAERPEVAAVCGRVREVDREASVYNRLCDLEWEAPPGEARWCGGNAMMRVEALRQAGGFAPELIAGEEPELCLRLRRAGWRIVRVAQDMVLHDAAMTRFGQWWRRSVRAGWAYAEGTALHGASAERHRLRENGSILFWGALFPAAAVLLARATGGASLLALAAYPALGGRIYVRALRRGVPGRDALPLAVFTVLGKLPQAMGQAQFVVLRALRRGRRVVDWRAAG